jgi:PIN domain nuclease of toxin-antitoxin system
VKILLDTCTFIWLCSEPDRFSNRARQILAGETDPELYLSETSIFEIALKCSLGKMQLPEPPRAWIEKQLSIWGIQSLPISREELFTSAELPLHHKDPFDRLLLATAKNNSLPIMTSDRAFSDYAIELIW